MINVVIPMAGAGSRFQAEGFDKPKPSKQFMTGTEHEH